MTAEVSITKMTPTTFRRSKRSTMMSSAMAANEHPGFGIFHTGAIICKELGL